MSKWTLVVSSGDTVWKKVMDINSCLDYLENNIDPDVRIISIQEEEVDNDADDLLYNIDGDKNGYNDGEDDADETLEDYCNNDENGSVTEYVFILSEDEEEDLSNSSMSREKSYLYNTVTNKSKASCRNKFTHTEISTTIEKLSDSSVGSPSKDAFELDRNPPSRPFGKYQCFVCHFNFAQKIWLSRHLMMHFDLRRSFRCPVCDKTYQSRRDLTIHINCCADIRPYQCEQCDDAFPTSSALAHHRRKTHSGISPFKCTKCEYTTFVRKRLENHMVVHMKERPFKCNYCSYASAAQRYLTAHLKLHLDDKRYKCDICYFRFVEANLLRNHRKKHFVKGVKIHQCRFCSAKLGSRSTLRYHVEHAHRDEIYK